MRTCTKCKITKASTEFSKINGTQARTKCKECYKKYNELYRKKNSKELAARKKVYRASNLEREAARKKAYQVANPEKVAAYEKAYRKANTNKINAVKKVWRANNPDKEAARGKAYRTNNPGKCAEATRLWCTNNPDKYAEIIRKSDHARRARKAGAIGSLSKGLFAKLFTLQRGKCPVCKVALTNVKPRSPMDHVIALANGGANEDSNMQILCKLCNSQKHAKDPIVFMQSKGFLI